VSSFHFNQNEEIEGGIMKIDPAGLNYKDMHDVMMGCIMPRPIAFVSTISENGIYNLAPYSCVSPVSNQPPLVGISIGTFRDGRKKDTLINIQSSKEFVINIVTEDLGDAMNKTSTDWPIDVDEFKEVGLTAVKADLVKAPMVAESPINMECRLRQIVDAGDATRPTDFVIGQVLCVHINDEFFIDSEIQVQKLKVIGRMGGEFYCRTRDIFEMKRPYILK
jgi:flavin reductase (DIM6/NTAB) family NADH-FMN oxidoreductase RutF